MTDTFKLKFLPGLPGADGADGADGSPPNISVGTVTTGSAGTTATVSIAGTSPNYSLSFTIPQGANGSGTGNVSASTTFATAGQFILSSDTTTFVLATTTVDTGTINSLTAGTTTITALYASALTVSTFSTGTTTVSLLNATRISAGTTTVSGFYCTSGSATLTALFSAAGTINNLTTGTLTSGTTTVSLLIATAGLTSGTTTVSGLYCTSGSATLTALFSSSGTINNLTAGTLSSGTTTLTVLRATSGTFSAGLSAGTLSAGTTTITTLYATAATITSLGGTTASFGTTTISVLRVDTVYGTTTITFSGSGIITQGKHTINMLAGSMIARSTNGATANTYESPTNKNMLSTLDFGTTTTTYAQFSIPMPKSWNQSGTLTVQFEWSPVGSTTTNNGVIWFAQALARSDGDTWDAAFGTAVATADTSGTSTISYITPESANITPSGSPAQSDILNFQIFRTYGTVSGGNTDTLTSVARLHSVRVLYYVNAPTDV